MKKCVQCGAAFDEQGWKCPACGHEPGRYKGYLTFAPALARDNDGWDPVFFEHLATDEMKHFWFRARNRLLMWALKRYFPDAHNFLEIGCGTGYVLSGIHEALEGLTLFGSDILCEGLAFAGQRCAEATLFQSDARNLPFENEFDVVGAFDMLEHVEEDEAVLEQFYKALRPGGGLLLTVPQHRFLWSVADDYSYHKRRYTRADLAAKLKRARFEVTRVTSFVSLLLPLVIISRMTMPKRVEDFDRATEYRAGPVASRILEGILRFELSLIRMDVNLPMGGSLLAIARR